jgi:hypothetical protein
MGSFQNQIQNLKTLNNNLVENLLSAKNGTSNKSHKGVSLGKTVVSGGRYANKAKGISGSIHWNSALHRKPKLQQEVFATVAAIINEAFGAKRWFKRWMNFYKRTPDLAKYLIPGTPCTSVWWSYDDRPFNLHHDWNTYGAAFLFCPEERKGGNVVIENPDGAAFLFCPEERKGGNVVIENPEGELAALVHMSEGKVLCGRWACSPHCNEPVTDGETRFPILHCRVLRQQNNNGKVCTLL